MNNLILLSNFYSRVKVKICRKKGFSVAEAMIALLIGSIALGMAAPMITKQIKIQNSVDIERRIFEKRIENTIPQGVVVMWSGSTSNIPVGWALCDGTKGTPDLRGRFIVGVDNVDYFMGTTGGEKEVALTLEEMPKHDHVVMEYAGHWKEGVTDHNSHIASQVNNSSSSYTGFAGGKKDGATKPHENRPPYYALAYIMKIK